MSEPTPPQDSTLAYRTKVTMHRGAPVMFILSIISAMLFCLIIPPVVVFVISIFVLLNVKKNPQRSGLGFAISAVAISAAATMLGLLSIVILLPSLGKARELSNRSVCAANLRGIMQSLNVYGSDNADAYPSVHFAPYSPALNNATATAGPPAENAMIFTYYHAPFRQAGSPQAILWQLVLRGDLGPKQFICKSDPWSAGAGQTKDGAGNCYDNFQNAHQLSYSITYPWKSDGTVGNWFKANIDASQPFLSDAAPEQGTGSPARDVTTMNKNANSLQHQGDGQNIAYGDAHVEFNRLPNAGPNNDNIFTSSAIPSRGPSETGIPASKSSPVLTTDVPPFDTVMYPIRNETTGGY